MNLRKRPRAGDSGDDNDDNDDNADDEGAQSFDAHYDAGIYSDDENTRPAPHDGKSLSTVKASEACRFACATVVNTTRQVLVRRIQSVADINAIEDEIRALLRCDFSNCAVLTGS
eukprot:258563-Rhodomonas_salina.1